MLWAAYGDYGANTGPIHVLAIDPANLTDGWVNHGVFQTQETWVFRNGQSGRLWMPYLDPIRGDFPSLANPHSGFAYADTADGWTVGRLTPYPEHVMDMVETAEALFACGSTVADDGSGGPVVWKSTDRGATWTEDLYVDDPSIASDPARFYCFYDWGDGSLSVTYTSNDLTPEFRAYHRPAAGDWTAYDDPILDGMIDFAKAVSDATRFTYEGTPFQLVTSQGKQDGAVDADHQNLTAHVQPGDEALLDAIQATLPASGLDAWVSDDGDRAYVISRDNTTTTLWRGDTTGTWTSIATYDVDNTACMTVDEDGGYVYLGTTDSAVVQVALPT